MTVTIDDAASWRDIARVGDGEMLVLTDAAWDRIAHANRIVASLVEKGIRAYGVNTGVGALASQVVAPALQEKLSRNIILSHACGVGELVPERSIRAVIAAQVANFAHGHSGVRPQIVRNLLTFLERGCVPDVPSRGSAGYLTHNAHIALVLIGEGRATVARRKMSGREA
ncbi:MAG: histidine ammonia-lyase, partial [Mesorhizobium sp.]